MPMTANKQLPLGFWVFLAISAGVAGCHHFGGHHGEPPDGVPRENTRVALPPYVIQPPDILVIDAVRIVPLPPYKIQPLDALVIQVTPLGGKEKTLLPDRPIAGIYRIEPSGAVNLGFDYGEVRVVNLTVPQARTAIKEYLEKRFKDFVIDVAVAESRALQQIRGEHLVRTDGTVGLGTYGSVVVDGLTIAEAKGVIEQHLAQFLYEPEISLDVSGYNSQVYYVIADGAGSGEQVTRLPLTGKETVLDAIGLVNGLGPVSTKHIWVARPPALGEEHPQILRVDWRGITSRGEPETNYQILPGDRIYVKGAPLIRTDTYLARIISPMERILGIGLLASTTISSYETLSHGPTTGTTGTTAGR
jgi:polysaccharide export outer membrane protein